MASRLRQYLLDIYKSQHAFSLSKKYLQTASIQIDDQDDNDSIADFCNIFCSVGTKNGITLEFYGRFPMTKELADLVEIYNGYVDPAAGKMAIRLTLDQIEVLRDLSDKIRKTSLAGDTVNNPAWSSIAGRTISSLYRFMRIIKEYRQTL
jgi:phage/plasmid-associated DNA primase